MIVVKLCLSHLLFLIRFSVVVVLFFLAGCLSLNAQKPPTGSTLHWMESQGFENIQISIESDTAFIAWENRIYRYEVLAIKEILEGVPLPPTSVCVFMPKYTRIAMLSLLVSTADLESFRNSVIGADELIGKIKFKQDMDQWISRIEKVESSNRSTGKVDLSIVPIIRYQLGQFNDPFRTKFSLAPTAEVHLAKGVKFTGQALIPVENSFDNDNGVTAGLLTLSKNVRLQDNLFLTTTAGYFTRRRLGIDMQMKNYFMNGRMGLNIVLGYTMPSTISGSLESEFHEDDNYLTSRIGLDYRVARYDLVCSLDYGYFLYNDEGWRGEILRQFGEVKIGLFGINATTSRNAGFYFSAPIIPRRYKKLKTLRIRPARHIDLGYRFRGLSYSGRSYFSGENIITKSIEFNPDFVRNQLLKELKAEK
jgi:hypothetical protein